MAVLSDNQRQAAWAELMRTFPAGTVIAISKQDLRTVVNAVDQVLSDNAAALNTAIQAITSQWNTLPVAVKSFIFQHMVDSRWASGV